MYNKILVALDGSAASEFAGKAAVEFANAFKSQISACHVDGSEDALKAVSKAALLGSALNKQVHITAAYDPVFHIRIFNTIAGSFSNLKEDAPVQ